MKHVVTVTLRATDTKPEEKLRREWTVSEDVEDALKLTFAHLSPEEKRRFVRAVVEVQE